MKNNKKIDIKAVNENENMENIVIINSAFTITDKINAIKDYFSWAEKHEYNAEYVCAFIAYENFLKSEVKK